MLTVPRLKPSASTRSPTCWASPTVEVPFRTATVILPGGEVAPALEKGLELLEVLAAEPVGLTQKQLADHVGRSVSEIFRMLGVLQQRGYIIKG